MMPKLEYKIITTNSIEDMEKTMTEMLNNGWQKASPITIDRHDGVMTMLQEVVRPEAPAVGADLADVDRQFAERYDKMDPKIKDLLEINDIHLRSVNGEYTTTQGKKVSAGIFPGEVLSMLKASKHCPLDLDEQLVLNEVESLV